MLVFIIMTKLNGDSDQKRPADVPWIERFPLNVESFFLISALSRENLNIF